MRRFLAGAAALLLAVSLARALDEPKKDKPPGKPASPAEQVQAVMKDFQAAERNFMNRYRSAKTPEERQKLLAERPKRDQFAQQLLDLAEKFSKEPAALDALVGAVSLGEGSPIQEKALEKLLQDPVTSDKLGPVCGQLAYSDAGSAEKLLRAVLAKNPHRDVQGQACLALAQYLKNLGETRGNAGQAAEAEKLFDQVLAKYADVRSGRGTLGDTAKGELFELRNLGLGKEAPEIEGEDVDGKKFKLSDYRGKVLVLDFWGHW
jgi:hypothetical protein